MARILMTHAAYYKKPPQWSGSLLKVERSKPALRVSRTFLMISGKKCKFFFTFSAADVVECRRMMMRGTSVGLREARLLRLKGYPGDVSDTYVQNGLIGAAAGGASLILEGVDQGLRAISGRAYEAPTGIMGRTRRDLLALFGHVGKGEFVKAGTAAWSIVSGDIVMDGIDVVGGFRR
jgi:hypothetical protein